MGKQVTTGQTDNQSSVQEAAATADTTTGSATDALVSGMTLTPIAGTYRVTFSGSVQHSSNSESIFLSIYAGGAQETNSEREFKRGGGQGDVTSPFSCVAVVTVNGSQAIEGRWRTPAATATMHARSLVIERVA
jgi:hypothetical protein